MAPILMALVAVAAEGGAADFERVSLKAGESRRVRFTLVPERDFARYDETRKAFALEPGEFEVELGASSADLRVRGRLTVEREYSASVVAPRVAEIFRQAAG